MGKLILNIHRGSEDIPFSKLSRKVIFVCHTYSSFVQKAKLDLYYDIDKMWLSETRIGSIL